LFGVRVQVHSRRGWPLGRVTGDEDGCIEVLAGSIRIEGDINLQDVILAALSSPAIVIFPPAGASCGGAVMMKLALLGGPTVTSSARVPLLVMWKCLVSDVIPLSILTR